METEQKLNIDYYIEMFKSDPEKDMKKGKILKKDGCKWFISNITVKGVGKSKRGTVTLSIYQGMKGENLIREIAFELFTKVENLMYINYYAENFEIFIQGNIILQDDTIQDIRDRMIPAMYKLSVNKIPERKFERAGIIAIQNGEIKECMLELN